MKREELLQVAKPILFNADMVQAILEGRKTVTRRVVKMPPYYPYFYKMHDNSDGAISGTKDRLFAGFYNERKIFYIDGQKHIDAVYYKAPYQPGDILYVRETWQYIDFAGDNNGYIYKASENEKLWETESGNWKWRPSIHMPKEAARIFLNVTNVWVERLQCMSWDDICNEGIIPDSNIRDKFSYGMLCNKFKNIWDSTVKKSNIEQYGWDANPWVWVIEFEGEVEE